MYWIIFQVYVWRLIIIIENVHQFIILEYLLQGVPRIKIQPIQRHYLISSVLLVIETEI